MPRIYPLIRKITTILSGGGPNPLDAFSLGLKVADTVPAESDAVSFAFRFPETNLAPTEAVLLGVAFADLTPVQQDALLNLGITFAETAPAQADAATFAVALAQTEANAAPTDTLVGLQLKGLGDTIAGMTEGRTVVLRCWASGCTSNDNVTGNTVNPGAANGQNDGVFAGDKTGTGTADTTNPVTVSTGSMNVPAGIVVVSAKIRVWFKVASIQGSVADSLSISYNTGGGPAGTVWQGPALATVLYAGEDYSTTPTSWTKDVSTLTLAQLRALQLVSSYNAGIVLAPQTGIQIDAWAVDIIATI